MKLFHSIIIPIPIIIKSVFVSTIFFLSRILYKRYRNLLPVRILGKWEYDESGGNSIPVGGLSYYISSPQTMLDFLKDPFHILFYVAFTILLLCNFIKNMDKSIFFSSFGYIKEFRRIWIFY